MKNKNKSLKLKNLQTQYKQMKDDNEKNSINYQDVILKLKLEQNNKNI